MYRNSSSINGFLLLLLALFLVAAQSLDDIQVGDRIKLSLRNGGKLEGDVIETGERTLVLKHKFGRATVFCGLFRPQRSRGCPPTCRSPWR